MGRYTKGAAVALLLAGTALAAGVAAADNYGNDNNRSDSRGYNHRGNSTVTIGFGNIAFGYRDGYWDNGHHWHHWRNRHDYQGYRDQNGSNFHDMNHDREHNNGWER